MRGSRLTGAAVAESSSSGGGAPPRPRSYDVIVVGLGAMGSAAAYHLARRRQRVLGLEAFTLGHTFGSSHGESRITRQAYYEHPSYVPLLLRAYSLWETLQQEAGTELLRLTGGLFVGRPQGHLVTGSLHSARLHQLPHEVIDAAEIRRRYPQCQVRDDQVAVFEPRAGILFPERCIEAHLRLAGAAGAELRYDEPMRAWSAAGDGLEIRTDSGRYRAPRVVFTAGSWLGPLLADLRLPLQPERNVVFWLQPQRTPEQFEPDRFPIFIWETEDAGTFYGVPHLQRPGVKVARHHSGETCRPETVRREADAADELPVRRFVKQAMPALDGPVAGSVVCLYTNTPDEHFVIDRHPSVPGLFYAGGFSGHGFKFSSVVGEILADLVTEGQATADADFLRADRLR
ncbi:MAG TPA: N-methyl-L-tryptophan oxidase [Chloroflexota bacterium]|jgi:sarcosine oxidase|nr:N-methyl-L-tryptophan oxidase [Chloroflexota bacterium]